MMGFGHMSGGGYCSSSNSNLSALAPPFTVERQSPNPYPSNPNLDYSASSYGIKPYGQQWDNYASPSAPVTEVSIDSTGINTQLSVDDYPYKDSVSHSSLSGSFLGAFAGSSSGAKYVGGRYDYGAKVDPYYRPFVPLSAGEDVSFWDEGSRRYADGSGYGNNNNVELDGNFLSLKVNDGGQLNQHYQGGRTYEDKFGEDSGCLYQHNSDVPSGKVTAGPFSMGNIEDDSRIWKLSGFIPYESNGVNLAGSSSNYPRPRPSVPSIETTNSLSSYQSACGSYGNYHRKVDSPFTGLGSVARSFPSVVIRPPPAFDCNLPEDNISHESALKDDAVGSNMRNFDNSSDSLLLNLGCDVKDNTLEAKLISDKFLSSSSGEKLQNQLRAEDTLDREIGGKSESKMSYMNASDGCLSACENITVAIKSNEAIDYQNTAVDSPCWRGAPPSQFSLFDVEASIPNPFSKILKGKYAEELENLNSVHSETARSEKVESNGNGENGASGNSAMYMLEHIRDGLNISGKYSYLLNDLKIGPSIKTPSLEKLSDEKNAGMILNHVPEGGAVAVHASEEVLFSPSSRENTECNNTSDPKLNVPVILKAICNLSETLRYHIAGNDAFSLDDDSSESLRRTISNLKACMSKKITQDSNETRGDIPLLGNLGNSVKPVYMANFSGDQATEHVNKYLPDEKRNDHSAINKDEKSSVVSPALDDLDVETDPATKAIHRILEEDFQIDEEMHPQALLYKNLWLESEAELCAIGYRARFDRMRLRMEKMKPDATQASIGLIPQVNASPDDSNGLPSRGLEARDITAAKSTTKPLNISSTPSPPRGHADDVDASFMDRINTVRFWGKNVQVRTSESTKKGTNKEVEPQLKAADGAQSVITSRVDVLKSREDNFNSDSAGEKFQSNIIDVNEDDEPVSAVMARYNILKLPEDNFKTEENFQAKMGDGDYEEERTSPDAPRQRILKSRGEGSNVIGKGKTVNEDSARCPDASSSSDWEHVQKDEFSCNNY